MLILDTTTKSLQVLLTANVATRQLPVVASYVDVNQSDLSWAAVSETDSNTANQTAVTVVGVPGPGISRHVKFLSVQNADTANTILTLRANNNNTLRNLLSVTLQVNDTLVYRDGQGFLVLDTNGNEKVIGSTALGIPVVNGSFTVTTTGNIDDLDFANAAQILMNNASLSTLRGLKAGVNGQQVTIISIGAGEVDLAHANTSSLANNRLINFVTSGITPLAPNTGTATYQYDGTTLRWRLVNHTQGAPIGWAVTAHGLTNGGAIVADYVITGRTAVVRLHVAAAGTMSGTTGSTTFTGFPYTQTGQPPFGTCMWSTDAAASIGVSLFVNATGFFIPTFSTVSDISMVSVLVLG